VVEGVPSSLSSTSSLMRGSSDLTGPSSSKSSSPPATRWNSVRLSECVECRERGEGRTWLAFPHVSEDLDVTCDLLF
jgi:hypothetical protein